MENTSKPSVIEELEIESSNRVFTGPAKRLIDKLAPMSSHVEAYQKRWFWELLQNACDYNDQVKIEVEITKDFLCFRHNGKAFTMNQALNLILPDSDKDDKADRNVVGRYGSGFIATHILSTEIRVSGLLLSKQNREIPFSFPLNRMNREEKEKTQLANCLQDSQNQFRESLIKAAPHKRSYTTEFKYNLSKPYAFVNAEETVERGLSFIEEVLPYVFAFQPKLIEVAIVNGKERAIYSCARKSGGEAVTTVIDYEEGTPKSTDRFTIRLFPSADTFVAVEVEDGKIVELPKDLPKLFKVYPLIGTEEFPFPCVVHSLDLVPNLERSTIELSENDKANREVLQRATVAYGMMLEQLCKEDYACCYNVCELSPGSFETKVKDWFKASISDKLKEKLLVHPVVATNEGKRTSLKFISIPCCEKVHYASYYRLIDETNFSIPIEAESERWSNVVNFSVFPEAKFDFKNLLDSTIGKKHPLSGFLKSPETIYDWLKDFINLLILSEQSELLKKYPIVPQQDGRLRTLDSQIFWDNEIPEELKDIHELISKESFRALLLHKSLEEIGEKLLESKREKSEKDILESIDKAMQNASEDEHTPEFLDALRRILNWTSKIESDELKRKMPWFATERPLLVMRALTSDANRDMVFSIIQSGKMEILAELVKSGVSNEKLASLVEISRSSSSMESLVRIGKIAEEIGGYEKILERSEELLEEKQDKEFKLRIGKDVEDILKDLLSTDLPHYIPQYLGSGPYDFVIKNERNGKEYYLELKSIKESNMEAIKMAISQARHACEYPHRSALCVIRRPSGTGVLTKEFLRKNIICVYQIGTDLRSVVDEADQVSGILRASKSIKLFIKDAEMKAHLDQKYIDRLGKSFESLKGKIIEQLG